MRLRWLLGAVVLAGCAEEVPTIPGDYLGNPGNQNPGDEQPSGDGDSTGLPPGPGTGVTQRGLPCEIEAIVDTHCALCHGAAAAYGAPNSLVTQADFQALSATTGAPYYALANERVHSEASPMPPTSQDRMPEASIAALTQWLEAGAPRNTESCSGGEFPGDGDGDGDGTVVPPISDVTEIIYDPINPEDCDATIDLLAFDPKDPSKGFPVSSSTANTYECFIYDVPHTEKMQGLQIEAIIDDQRVLHHWLVYEQAGAAPGKQDYYNCAGQHPNAALIGGWAPGRGDTKMPRGVGLRLPEKGKSFYVIEVHYNNSAGHRDVRDKSGARVCATKKLKGNEAAYHWLGSEAINIGGGQKGNVTGTCTAPKRSVVLNSWPHMHEIGTHMKVDLIRKGGSPQMVLDNPFSFDDQRSYDTPMILEAGDKLRTTCTFHNRGLFPVGFGTASEAEMCYNFVLAYPAGSLRSGFSLTVTDNTCIDLF